jgi:hypothetical protein
LARRGLEPGDEGLGPADGFAEELPTLAGLASASVRGRIALGARAGTLVRSRSGCDAAPMGTCWPR